MSQQGGKAAVETKIIDKNDGSYAISFIASDAGQYEVTVQINGENMRKFPPFRVKERTFTPVKFIGKGINDMIFCRPWGVAVNDSNKIFVSDIICNRILVFNEKGDLISFFGPNRVDEPTGITIDNQGRVFVVSRGNNEILVFNPNGEYVSTAIKSGSLKQPRGISLDSRGNIIVCDSGNQCVKIFSPGGNILRTIGVDRLHLPFGCLCYEDKIFVSDREAHCVKVYSSEGKFLYEFGKHGTGDEKLNSPTGIAVDKTGHLLVCSSGSHRVQVFTLDGKFVTKFGKNGERLGQFDNPITITVLTSGHIVVTEFGNFRLQLFA